MNVPRWLIVAVVVAAIAGGVWLVATSTTPAPPAAQGPATPTQTPTPITVPEDARTAWVDYVHDGDTLFLQDGTKVRLLGIDTPEVGENLECYGDEATALLRDMLPQGTRVHVVADVQPLDQFGRSLLFVFLDDGSLVNIDLIEAGAAESVVLEPNILWADELEAAEGRAQGADAGMWGAC